MAPPRIILGLVLAVVALAFPGPASAVEPEPEIGSTEFTVTVKNANRSLLVCATDGRSHALRGRLVGPSEALSAGRVDRINVLVHDITTGGWFWQMPGHPDVDYASRLGDQGEVSLVFDRLGYDASPLADGRATCLGGQADMLHQVITAIRGGAAGPVPDEVVVHGHAAGAAIAQAEASRWKDVDGLVLMSWSDAGVSARAITESTRQHSTCLFGVERAGVPKTYAWFGKTPEDFREIHFASASAAVQQDAAGLRNPDPCGDAVTLGPLVLLGNVLTRTIDVPVLLLYGQSDVLNRPNADATQRIAYAPGADVTVHEFAGAGGALPLESVAGDVRAVVVDWLRPG